MEYLAYAERVGQRRGFRKGKIEGKIEGRQHILMRLLELRFSNVPEGMQAVIKSLTDPAALDELFAIAFKCRSLKSFESRLLKEQATANGSS